MRTGARNALVILLCTQLIVAALPRTAMAGKPAKPWIVEMQIGQPSVWSLAQAHYLLAQLHQKNRSLDTQMPGQADLNPNRANSTRIEILRTLLGVEAQFDQSVGVKNQIALDRFRDQQAQSGQARAELATREAELRQAERDLLDLDETLARLKVQDSLADAARGTAPPTRADRERKEEIAVLQAQRTAKAAERDRLQGEVTALRTAATTQPSTPELATTTLSSTPAAPNGEFPAAAGLSGFVTKALESAGNSPSVAASIALDNYIGMQYEIIAKQLTLLRDEVGPEERVIFLELPTSIYTADGWANGYMAQVSWKVTRYWDQEPGRKVKEEVLTRDLQAQGVEDKAIPSLIQDGEDGQEMPVTLEMIAADQAHGAASAPKKLLHGTDCPLSVGNETLQRQCIRTLEIVPRQSALNVNEFHATTNNSGFLGVLRLLSGFGAKVNFQRQKELYETFLQQEIFASGFGKGRGEFGWIFGPTPGSDRIAPGQRTTYAVLAVPKNTLALELEAEGTAFRRRDIQRGREVGHGKFVVLVPSEKTEGFWVDGVSYTPVKKGENVVALLEGNYFSPQLGILVNGVPLRRVLSVTRAGVDEPRPSRTGSGVEGEFEITNSREIVLSFSMGSAYMGTPIITLVTPEKSAAINSFKMKVNFRPERERLRDASFREPMFLDEFALDGKLEETSIRTLRPNCKDPAGFALFRLKGRGLRRHAEISVGDTPLEFIEPGVLAERVCKGDLTPSAALETTHSYFVYVQKPLKTTGVSYRQPTRQGFDDGTFKHVLKPDELEHQIRHYGRSADGRRAEVDLTLTIPGEDGKKLEVALDDPPEPGGCSAPQKDENGAFRVKCGIPLVNGGERDFATVKVVSQGNASFIDLQLPVRPRLRSVSVVDGTVPELPAGQTGRAVLRGVNLHRVTGVLFGKQEALLVGPADPEVLIVEVPRVEVPPGEETQVPIILQTEAGALPTGLAFTYRGVPLPKGKEK